MTTLVDRVVLALMSQLKGSQRTLVYGAETVTRMASPAEAVPASPGEVHVVDPDGMTSMVGVEVPETPSLIRVVLTEFWIWGLPLLGSYERSKSTKLL